MDNRFRLEILNRDEVEEIYQSSLKILEETGVAFNQKEALSFLDRNGADVDFNKSVVRFPPGLVEDMVRKVPRTFTLYYRDFKKRIDFTQRKVYFSIAGDYAGYVLDYRTGERRKARLKDAENLVLIDDALECFEHLGPPIMPQDVPPPMIQIKAMEAVFKNTTKPSTTFIAEPREGKYIFKMLEAIAGGGEALRKRPITSVLCQPTSPLSYGKELIEKINECARRRIPISLASGPSCGITAPVTIAGFSALGFAEALAGIVYTQLIEEETPMMTGIASIVMNFRDGSGNIATPEAMLGSAVFVQLAHYADLIAVACSGTDSKLPTIQTGYEKALSALFVVLSGAELCSIASLDDWGTTAMEQHVIDAEIMSAVARILRGIIITPETIALDVIDQVGVGGNFLTHKHTFQNFKKEHWFPEISFRESWETLRKRGGKTMVDNAEEKVAEILRTHKPVPLEKHVQKELEAIVKEAQKELLK